LGKIEWICHGEEKRPALVHVAQAQAQMPEGVQKIVQATVKVQLRQSLVIRDRKGNIVGGDLEKIMSPVEYIVLERWLDNPSDTWKIKGKLEQGNK
jgi:hypothetical protein